MRRNWSLTVRFALALGLATSAFTFAPRPAQAAYPSFTFNGSGYGHGIGLSQYGAKGWAEHGKLGEWIAAYYYPGTTIATKASPSVRVNVDSAADYDSDGNAGFTRSVWTLRPGYVGATLQLTTAGGTVYSLSDTNGPYTFAGSGNVLVVKNRNGLAISGSPFSGQITITPLSGSEPQLTQIMGASGPFGHSDVRYRGTFKIQAASGKVEMVNSLSMQQYLYGVVPRESPSSWHVEALKAQAIVARSYASSGTMYCTTRSQVYNGHSRGDRANPTMHEAATSNGAVDSTKDRYVTYNGAVIRTYFHSSSGGHTANVEDVWLATGEPSSTHAYRRGVDDPYCSGPYDPWPDPLTIDGLKLAQKLATKTSDEPAGTGTTVWVNSLVLDRAYPSDFVRRVDVNWSNGAVSRGVSGDAVRNALGLRSTKFYVGARYERIAYGDRYSTAVKVSQAAFPDPGSASAAIIANGGDKQFPDALTSAALGGAAHGPVLLTLGSELPGSVKDELVRLRVPKVYIVGGTASVSPAVEAAVRKVVPNTVRLAGPDRYATAASVALEMKKLPGVTSNRVLVASGEVWMDAAVAAAVASGAKRPLLLTAASALPNATADALKQLNAVESAVFGGPKAIGDNAVARLCGITGEKTPTRRFGTAGDRYTTAVGGAQWCVSSFGYSLKTVYVTSGEKFPDTVTGGVLSGAKKAPLLLTPTAAPSKDTAAYLAANRTAIETLVVIGGPSAVSDSCASTLAGYAY